jgi:hypothetical protein
VLIEARPGDDAGLTVLLDAAVKELFTRYPDSSSHFLDPIVGPLFPGVSRFVGPLVPALTRLAVGPVGRIV